MEQHAWWHNHSDYSQIGGNRHSCVTTKRDGKTDKKEGKHQKRNSSQHQKERNSPNSSENEDIEAQQEQRGTEK